MHSNVAIEESELMPAASEPSRGFKAFANRLWQGWATRSLAVGAVATIVDLSIGTSVLLLMGSTSRAAAMIGTVGGATFTFFANRYFAFREHDPKLASPAVRYIIVAAIAMTLHGQLVVWMREGWGIPFVPAKMLSDICVYNGIQLLVFRYIVFPRGKTPPPAPTSSPLE